ncbi:methyl-accepting chemotaxis protein, CheC-like family [Aliivibrio wodanis]|uniref:Methyl-accepting chemotaxis protein, CheC-like family n=1 Tax=Aliivibrio wodanis TaxID=80852 RepID=A0A090IAS7_9GAMM|nr:methyl-accepting chemotaxis protein, CheC-like family [Aliivibrio wodanis]
MNIGFINPFLVSLINVVETMSNIKLVPKKPMIKTEMYAKGDISGLIGMASQNLKGSLSITFEKKIALIIMKRMLDEIHKEIDRDVIDMVGEITNMVTGGAKRLLSEQNFDFDMAIPVVVSGNDHMIKHQSKDKIVLIPLYSEFGYIFLEISFE